MKSMITTLSAILLSTLLAPPQASAAPNLVVDRGILMGANGVEVGGALYNVEFKEGSCNSLFSNCTTPSFAFTSQSSANAASRALLDQVFINGLLGNFDSEPSITNGCATVLCFVYTPFQLNGDSWINTVAAINENGPFIDSIRSNLLPRNLDLGFELGHTYAVWSTAQPVLPNPGAPVSEPGTLSLVAASMFAAHSLRRRKNT